MGLLPKPNKAKRVAEVRKYVDAMNDSSFDHESLPDIESRSEQQITRLQSELNRQKAQGVYGRQN